MFELNLRSRAPVYEQLVEKIKELIINNVLKPDQHCRPYGYWRELTINPNTTIQKLYRELEHRGYIPGARQRQFCQTCCSRYQQCQAAGSEKELGKIISEMLYLGVIPLRKLSTWSKSS